MYIGSDIGNKNKIFITLNTLTTFVTQNILDILLWLCYTMYPKYYFRCLLLDLY